MAVDPSLFDMLDIEFLQRQKQSEQLIPGTALISDRMAKKYFGRTDVSGENIEFCISNEKQLMQIAGVFKQLPSYSSFHADFIYKS
jgi:putative ABC transport system permease protein